MNCSDAVYRSGIAAYVPRIVLTTRNSIPRDPVKLVRRVIDTATRPIHDAEGSGNDSAAVKIERNNGAARAAKVTAE